VADLKMSQQMLDELVEAFNGFGDLLSSALRNIRVGDAAVTGDDPLAGDVRIFASSWNYGLTQLGQHGEQCTQQLKMIGKTFDKLETQLTSELKTAGKKRSGS
jgi:hypothetical protein